MARIESLLAARLFLQPSLVGNDLYFLSDLSGRISLYRMPYGGGMPEPLLPPHIALQNPHLLDPGKPFAVFPELKQVLVMIDRDGDENYQPMRVPLEGGFPEPVFGDRFEGERVFLVEYSPQAGKVYLVVEHNREQLIVTYQGDIESGELVELARSRWGFIPYAAGPDHDQVALVEEYASGDTTLFRWRANQTELELLSGEPRDRRETPQPARLTGFDSAAFTPDGRRLLMVTALFNDSRGPAVFDLESPAGPRPLEVEGLEHTAQGELLKIEHLYRDRFLLQYNVDGVSWAYEAHYRPEKGCLQVEAALAGKGRLAGGVLESIRYDPESDSFVLAFSTATSPAQIYTVETDRKTVRPHTRERLLGLPLEHLSPGEEVPFPSFDGTRIPARLYLPSEELGFSGPRPLVYYVHGGPQSQERPDFTWFSMPLIQFLTLNGFAVFVPNVRGSTGYGLAYTKQVDRDWGGKDRLDHVHAMTQVLPLDPRLDLSRAAVVGRSYGGYMSLTLAGRHPELWSAAVDMFGPYDLLTFADRLPESWKPYFHESLGDPQADRDFLVERSPRTHLDRLACPLLVIQGRNDPRVVEAESRDLVEALQKAGKDVTFLVFDDEGHDVLKFGNKALAYNTITQFLINHLKP